jgi:DNA-directed RNA polymerase specialized sigma subunit
VSELAHQLSQERKADTDDVVVVALDARHEAAAQTVHGEGSRRRGSRRRTSPLAEVEPEPVPGPETAYVAQDWVRSALAGLPDRERDVVTCLDVIGLDVAATAAALGISPVAVRVARHRGLKRLRGSFRVATG